VENNKKPPIMKLITGGEGRNWPEVDRKGGNPLKILLRAAF
jgi:hypothetical protein